MNHLRGHSGYLARVYDRERLRQLIPLVHHAIQTNFPGLPIAFAGTSGAAIAYPLSFLHGYDLIYIRKSSETTHGQGIESNHEDESDSYIILDDLISSGSTVEHIMYQLRPMMCKGIVLYDDEYRDINQWRDIPILRIKMSEAL